MKIKIFLLIFFLSLFNVFISFADNNIYTKSQLLFNSYENKLNNFTNEEQIKKVEHINNWITKILWWQLSKDDRLFLIYFKRLLIKKIDSLNNLKEDNIVALENINFDNFNDIYLENLKKLGIVLE